MLASADLQHSMFVYLSIKITKSMAGVVKSMDSALKSMNLEKASSSI